jgi:hypothetical protein
VCSGQPNDNVLAFQDTYNHIHGQNLLSMDGVYGAGVDGAMNGLVSAGTIPASALPSCTGTFGNTTTPPTGGGTTPPTGGGPITPVSQTTNVTTSTMPLVIGLLAVAGGVAAFYYLNKHHKGAAAPGHPAMHPARVQRRALSRRRR